jgi:TrmH family RNA methyltransferase
VTSDRPGSSASEHLEIITSAANPTIRLARSLHRKRVRQRERAVLVEGVRAIRTAVQAGTPLRVLILHAGRREQISDDLLEPLTSTAERIVFVASELFEQVAETEHPQPVIAICELPKQHFPQNCTFVLAIDGVRDPGNLGTLIRTAAAAGADGVALLPGTVDPYNAKVIRASAGALFLVPVQHFPTLEELVSTSFTEPPVTVLADAAGDTLYDTVDYSGPVTLVVGGEAAGAGEAVRTFADIVVRIPLDPRVESINAAVAGAILLFEVQRQRRSIV